MADKRFFTIDNSEIALSGNSRYESKTPGAAAAKAARRLFKESASKKSTKMKDEIRFTLRETTQGSSGKLFRYIGIKRKLDEPKVVSIAGTNVTYTHTYHVKSCKI
jgi:hypothetical protein